MKANEFIKKNGLEAAKKILSIRGGFRGVITLTDGSALHSDELRELVESHENIELLGGLVKSKSILNGAPHSADSFVLWTGKVRYLNSDTKCVFSEKSSEWNPANIMVLNLKISFVALRQAIADVESYGGERG